MASARTAYTSALVQAGHGQIVPPETIQKAVESLGQEVQQAYEAGGIIAAAQAADPHFDATAGLEAHFNM